MTYLIIKKPKEDIASTVLYKINKYIESIKLYVNANIGF